MNPEIEKRAIDAYDFLLKSLQDASVVVGEEGQKLLIEIAEFGFYENLISVIFSIVILAGVNIGGYFIGKALYNLAVKLFTTDDDDPTIMFPSVALVGLFVFVMVVNFNKVSAIEYSVNQCIKAAVAPRVYTIEYVNDLIKKRGK